MSEVIPVPPPDLDSLPKKLLWIQREASKGISKRGKNDFHGYTYVKESDVLEVKDLFNACGLIALPTLLNYEHLTRGDRLVVLQRIQYDILDTDTGETMSLEVLGAGEDKGEKGVYKASTGASKYFYLRVAGVPTHDDPELSDAPAEGNRRIKNQNQRRVQEPPVKGNNVAPIRQPQAKQDIPESVRQRCFAAAKGLSAIVRNKDLTMDAVKLIGGLPEGIDAASKAGEADRLEKAFELCKDAVMHNMAQEQAADASYH